MELADAFDLAVFEEQSTNLCSVQEVMEAHPEEADFIFDLITNGKPKFVGNAPLSRFLKTQGIHISDSVIGRHRQGGCKCADRMPERYES